jgi:putative transposase
MVPAFPLHLVLRGAAPAPPAAVLDRLRRVGGRLHAYVLMGTHVHLLLTPEDATGAERAREALGAREADATPVHARRYLLACMRYIELNPVRAGMVQSPEQYSWSSFGVNAAAREDGLVTRHPAIEVMGQDYRALFDQPLEGPQLEEIRKATRNGYRLGEPRKPRGRTRQIGTDPISAEMGSVPI